VTRNSRGFSLVELLVVVSLVFLLSGMAIPSIRKSVGSSRLRAAATLLASEISYARTIAVSRNAVFQVQFNVAAGTYQIVDPADTQNPPRIRKRLENGVSFANSPGLLRFHPRGNADSSTIQLRNEFNEFVTISVETSGMVTMGDLQEIGT
jgi:prepilin-type N-terminal cleavage/methylation domain-containing protein